MNHDSPLLVPSHSSPSKSLLRLFYLFYFSSPAIHTMNWKLFNCLQTDNDSLRQATSRLWVERKHHFEQGENQQTYCENRSIVIMRLEGYKLAWFIRKHPVANGEAETRERKVSICIHDWSFPDCTVGRSAFWHNFNVTFHFDFNEQLVYNFQQLFCGKFVRNFYKPFKFDLVFLSTICAKLQRNIWKMLPWMI